MSKTDNDIIMPDGSEMRFGKDEYQIIPWIFKNLKPIKTSVTKYEPFDRWDICEVTMSNPIEAADLMKKLGADNIPHASLEIRGDIFPCTILEKTEKIARGRQFIFKNGQVLIMTYAKRSERDYLPVDEREEVYKLFGYRCACCDTPLEYDKEGAIDHHRPFSKGFLLTPDNSVLLCQKCNSSKHDQDPEIFYTPERFYWIETMLKRR